MAVIGKIREKSTLVLIIIGGAIMAFVLTDLFSAKAGGGRQGPTSIAEVDGASISPQEFDFKVKQAYEQFQAQSPEAPLDEATKSTLREQVWNEMLSDALLQKRMDALGISVTTKELFDMVQGDNPHPQVLQVFGNPQTGEFNSASVVRFLQNLDNDPKVKEQWLDFEKALKRNQKFDKYYNLFKKGAYTPTALARQQFNDNNTQLTFKYVYKPYSSIVDSTVELSESEIKDYYDKNKIDYEQESSIGISYAYFPVEPSIKDREAAGEWADDMYIKFQKTKNDSTFANANSENRFDPLYYSRTYAPANVDTSLWSKEVGFVMEPKLVGDFYYIHKLKDRRFAPDSIKASHILVSTQTGIDPAVAEAKADSLLALLESGVPMTDLVLENSDDVSTAQDSGKLGWFTESTIIPIFREALSADIGTFSIVQSNTGFHVMEVTGQTEFRDKIQIATIVKEILPGKETYSTLFNEANSFSIEVSDKESFNALINENNIIRKTAVIGENDNLIAELPASRDLVRWAREVGEGEVSEAYDVDDAFVVVIIESVNKEGPAPLDRVRNRVEYLARQEKKAAVLKQELAGETDLTELAGNLGLSVESANNVTFGSPAIAGVGLEPEVVAIVMGLEQGQLSLPIQGENGVFVVSVDSKTLQIQENIAQVKELNRRGLASRIDNGAIFNAIKEKADLTDNRANFY